MSLECPSCGSKLVKVEVNKACISRVGAEKGSRARPRHRIFTHEPDDMPSTVRELMVKCNGEQRALRSRELLHVSTPMPKLDTNAELRKISAKFATNIISHLFSD